MPTKREYEEHYRTVDNANMMLRDNTVLFFKAVLTYSISALGLFFTLLVQFFKSNVITYDIMVYSVVTISIFGVSILLIFISMIIGQKAIYFEVEKSLYNMWYEDKIKGNKYNRIYDILEILILILLTVSTIFMIKVYISLLVYNVL